MVNINLMRNNYLLLRQKLPTISQVLAFVGMMLVAGYAQAQVSGTVFRDFNGNGTKDNTATFNEIGLAGITITAYDASGALVGSATSAADGTYTIPGISGQVPVEQLTVLLLTRFKYIAF